MATTFPSSSPLSSTKSEKFVLDRPFFANNYSSSPFVVVVKIPSVTTTRGRRVSSSVSCCCRKNDSRERKVTHKIMENYKKLHKYPGEEIDYILKEEDGATRWKWLTGGVDILSIMPPDVPRSGVLILVEALHREGVTDVFTNQDQSIPLKALSATTSIDTHTFLTHCSELLAATGYAMATGLPGVCMTSLVSEGLTRRFIHGMAYAYEKNIPLVVMVVDGWEKNKKKFSSTTGAEDCGRRLDETIKCRFSITSAKDIQKIVRKALLVARSGRPGPVLIDLFSYDTVNKLDTPVWDDKEEIPICPPPPLLLPLEPTRAQLEKVIGLLRESKRPLVYVGSGCFGWRNELTRFVELTGVPVFKAEVLDDTPVYLSDGDFSHIYRSPHNRFSVEHFDLLLAFDVRSTYYDGILDLRRSDSIILEFHGCEEEEVNDEKSFFDRHVQPGSVSSIRCGDTKSLLERLNHLLEEGSVGSVLDFSTWRKEINYELHVKYPFFSFEYYVSNALNEVTNRRDTFILTSYKGYRVRFWDWFSRGLSSARNIFDAVRKENDTVVSLPLVAGAAIGKGRRTRTITSGGGDEEEEQISNIIHIVEFSNVYNIEELVVLKRKNLPVKVVILNYILRIREHKSEDPSPADIVSMARSLEIPCRRIGKKEEVRDAMMVMMETPGPYVLDVVLQYDEYYDENEEPELHALDSELFLFWLGHQDEIKDEEDT